MEDRGHLVGMQVRMDQRRVRLHALHGVGNGGQLLILHLDQLHGFVGDLRGLGRHGRHGFPPVFGRSNRQEFLSSR